jgi:t-SNARE complex subunit (syntaxin)
MLVVEERLSLLEVKVQEIGTTLVRIEGALTSLVQMVVGLDQRVEKLDQRVQGLDVKLATVDQKVTGLDEKFMRLERRTDYTENRFDKLFLWVIGIQVTILLAIVVGLFGIVTRLI